MHDQMLTLFDDCVSSLLLLRGDLAANRRVQPGERRSTALAAIAAAERFATLATQVVTDADRESARPAEAAPVR
ncbi:hypothetical protein FB565_006535 [Actinoplanes lutulentus]|uniref:Uncharacterized protein n=1 Tax=Actinoplanes lutulentus TaxID=1287878 RepID=A0A327ZC41_9ACTN|nr:hypothetical protein [Actinoplanes lutulentus]MBB2946767.1 hypothetical protein [Actinoplanes lutulentus]RAK35659.1 hypothetical protein B0I29_109133 [Actinoplanes lutulentus]